MIDHFALTATAPLKGAGLKINCLCADYSAALLFLHFKSNPASPCCFEFYLRHSFICFLYPEQTIIRQPGLFSSGMS
jgi:hypothetical protein